MVVGLCVFSGCGRPLGRVRGPGPGGLADEWGRAWALRGTHPHPHSRERPSSLQSPQESAPETTGPEMDVEASEEEAVTLAEPGPQACLHISIAGSGLEMAPGPTESDPRPELVPFDSDSDDESSPSPSGTLQSQASRSTISSSFGSESNRGPSGSVDCPDERTAQWVLMGEEGPMLAEAWNQVQDISTQSRVVGASKVGRG